MGKVRLKSKSAAFSISAARDGGENASDVTATAESDLRAEDESLSNFCRIFSEDGILIWGIWILGFGDWEGMGSGESGLALEDATIMLAMADWNFTSFAFAFAENAFVFEWNGEGEKFFVKKRIYLLISFFATQNDEAEMDGS